MEKRTSLRERKNPGSGLEKWVTIRHGPLSDVDLCYTQARSRRRGKVLQHLSEDMGRLTIVWRYYALWHNIRLHYTRMRATQCGTVYL